MDEGALWRCAGRDQRVKSALPRENADGKRQVEPTIVRDRHELTLKAELGRGPRSPSPFEAEYFGPNRELERLLNVKAADQVWVYGGDDDDP